jgi:hypothetical protein
LTQTSRRHIRRAAEKYEVKRIVDPDEFVAQGHSVYCSFYGRTKYAYKNDRIDLKRFERELPT